MLSKFGFVINSEKSVFYATQKLEFLGFILNSTEMTLTLTEHKVVKLASVCSEFLKAKNKTIRDLSVLIGNLVASFPAVPYGQLFYRQLENEKITMLKVSKGNFDAQATLSELALSDINWWLSNISLISAPIARGQPDIVIETDASHLGWGYNCEPLGMSAGGPWLKGEENFHINVLELKAVYFALLSLCRDKQYSHVKFLIDNTTAVAYIREQDGSRSLQCNELARKIWLWAYDKNLWQ